MLVFRMQNSDTSMRNRLRPLANTKPRRKLKPIEVIRVKY